MPNLRRPGVVRMLTQRADGYTHYSDIEFVWRDYLYTVRPAGAQRFVWMGLCHVTQARNGRQ
jgi:hypothetical protein